MGSSSGGSSACTLMQNSGSETDLLDERKRKRMQSNRESAMRSRKRKQEQLDDLMAQVGQLGNENNQIIRTIINTTQHHLETEAENLVLRAQHEELHYRLEYLNQIISNLSSRNTETDEHKELSSYNCNPGNMYDYIINENFDGLFNQMMNVPYLTQQQRPIMASAEMFQFRDCLIQTPRDVRISDYQ